MGNSIIRRGGSRRTIRRALAALGASTLWVAAAASAHAEAAARRFDLPAANLDEALLRFAEQASVQVFMQPGDVQGLRGRPVTGQLTAQQALESVLGSARVKAEWTGPRTVVIRPLERSPLLVKTVQQSEPAARAPAPASDGGSQSPVGLEEVVVTAQRFAESAQKASVVISVIEAQQLQGITDVRQLQTVEPGIQLGGAGSQVQTFIRGVGSLNSIATQEGSVSYNADGVFLFQSTMITPMMYDIERIEVLKGPQGTLYGRNASAGAVNILTRGAKLNVTEARAEIEAGNYDLRRMLASVNLPLGENLALRLAGQHVEHSGYLSDGGDDLDLTAGRIRLLWEPSAAVSVQLGVDASKQDATGPGSSFSTRPFGEKFVGGTDPRLIGTPYALTSRAPNPPRYYKDRQWSGFAQVDVDLGFATLTVLPSYRFQDLGERNYIPGNESNSDPAKATQKSIEVRLANRTDALKWVLGAYYFDIKNKLNFRSRNESIFSSIYFDLDQQVTSYAFFGEATYSLSDRLRVIGGLRYTDEETTQAGFNNSFIGPPGVRATTAFDPARELGDFLVDESTSADAVTWKVGAEYDLGPNSMLFATASRGFKGGGLYTDRPGLNSKFRPEYVTAFELGSRNRFFDNRLQVNAELFYWKLKDQQISFLGFNSLGQRVNITVNAGDASLYGADLSVDYKPTEDDTFSLGLEYLHSEYDSFVFSGVINAAQASGRCRITPTTPGSGIVDCSGLPLIRAPEWSGSASYEHRFDLGSNGQITLNGNMTFATERYINSAYTEVHKQKSAALFNASATYRTENETVSLSAWVRNIGNEEIKLGGNQFNAVYSRPTLAPPRTYGLTLGLNF